MTFALTSFECYGAYRDEPLTNLAHQYARFTYTAANTDVDLDIGDYSGTFWTAVGGTAPGITALKAIKDINVRAKTYLSVGGNAIAAKYQGAAAASGVYTVAMDSTNTNLPNYLFASGDAPTSATIEICWLLKGSEQPVKVLA